MGSELDRDAATFADVARVIAEEEDDDEWLAAGLRSWIWPQERWPESARNFGAGLGMFADLDRVLWPRAQLVKVRISYGRRRATRLRPAALGVR
jgi:hypothetical protein